MNPALDQMLAEADAAISRSSATADGPLRVGVDLGTATIVLFALDVDGSPLVGAQREAEVVRDGVVVDFAGAVEVVIALRADLEARLGRELTAAATTYPPGVALPEVRATSYVLEAAGLECEAMVDEPTAANRVLGITDGAVVDVGGGTTGIARIAEGEVVGTADEPTGGRHVSLVIAGAYGIDFDEAEARKVDPAWQPLLLGVVRPVFEKVGTIVASHVAGTGVESIHLVGGTSAFAGIAEVVADVTGLPTCVPGNPLYVTPLGVALHHVETLTSPGEAREHG